ncbi:hypothetical protein EFW57_03047 [Bacillus velezensis]|nr:hypothetical protein EFW57_03047 [Bacillus velezensis]
MFRKSFPKQITAAFFLKAVFYMIKNLKMMKEWSCDTINYTNDNHALT